MRVGLEALVATGFRELGGRRVGFCCNHTAVDRTLRHGIDRMVEAGVDLRRLFGPEHGVRATAQDMIGVDETVDPVSGVPVLSLYGDDERSLRPPPGSLDDLDVVVFDIQDIGARYYTYQATLGFLMEEAGRADTQVMVLDRPNPITGGHVEGNVVQPEYESFVGAYPLAVRHGMTVGELAGFFRRHCGIECDVDVIRCGGWHRDAWFDETGLPWVYPSPNMPTLETAVIYPGMCLIEGTNLSEGRGTTRPFHLVGAPWLDPRQFAAFCTEGAKSIGLRGVVFRPAAFVPGFQKHAGRSCGGVEVHVVDREALDAFLLGMVVVRAAWRCDPERCAWRTETYEFVDEPIAIDLLTGSSTFRTCIERGGVLEALIEGWTPEREAFEEAREDCLLYG